MTPPSKRQQRQQFVTPQIEETPSRHWYRKILPNSEISNEPISVEPPAKPLGFPRSQQPSFATVTANHLAANIYQETQTTRPTRPELSTPDRHVNIPQQVQPPSEIKPHGLPSVNLVATTNPMDPQNVSMGRRTAMGHTNFPATSYWPIPASHFPAAQCNVPATQVNHPYRTYTDQSPYGHREHLNYIPNGTLNWCPTSIVIPPSSQPPVAQKLPNFTTVNEFAQESENSSHPVLPPIRARGTFSNVPTEPAAMRSHRPQGWFQPPLTSQPLAAPAWPTSDFVGTSLLERPPEIRVYDGSINQNAWMSRPNRSQGHGRR
jgi:hypothetical protein